MNQADIEEILNRYKSGNATEEDLAFLESWYLAENGTEPVQLSEETLNSDLDSSWMQIKSRIGFRKVVIWPKYAAAASIILAIGAGLFFINRPPKETKQALAKSQEIAPGGNKAFLTIGNGEKINLSDATKGMLANQNGTSVIKNKEGEIIYEAGHENDVYLDAKENTISTPAGGQWHLTLEDGTGVWLNAASELKYPSKFTGAERIVSLKGEAYFEVSKDRMHPFIVKSDNQDVKVLGTHFNINSYGNEPFTKTTLMEGSVIVKGDRSGEIRQLVPGKAAFNDGASIRLESVDVEADISWKNGFFTFNQADLKTVMRQFERWYDMKVTYEGKVPDVLLSGEVYRNVNASKALKILSYFNVHYKIKDKTVTITP